MMVGSVSSSVLLEHKGMESLGVRLAGEVGRGPVKKRLGCHGKELGLDPGGQWFSPLTAHQFPREFQKEIWMPPPTLPVKSESLRDGSWALTFF